MRNLKDRNSYLMRVFLHIKKRYDRIEKTGGENMVSYEVLYNDVKAKISERRFHHSEGVVQRALEYAEVYGADKEIVKCVAIAHDIAKEFSEEENEKYIQEYHIRLDEVEKINHNLIHAKVGAELCRHQYGFTEDMANAIKYHTTGRANMSLLEKIIYLADATDANRNYDDIEYYVDLIKRDIDQGVAEVCKWVIDDLTEKNRMIHENSIKCYEYYSKQ